VIGTLFTLFIVPSVYMLLARNRAPVIESVKESGIPALAEAV
jgi:hypothetical protein